MGTYDDRHNKLGGEAIESEKVLTADQVIESLGISRATFHNLTNRDPDFKTFKVGRLRKMLKSDLQTWIEKQKQKAAIA